MTTTTVTKIKGGFWLGFRFGLGFLFALSFWAMLWGLLMLFWPTLIPR